MNHAGLSPTIGIFPYVALAVEMRASYHRDNASVQRAPLCSAKCADNAGHPGDPSIRWRTPAPSWEIQPQQWTDTQPLRLQVDIYCRL